jgi:hypothetical protein
LLALGTIHRELVAKIIDPHPEPPTAATATYVEPFIVVHFVRV